MKSNLKKFALSAGIMLALALAFAACSYDPDKDGDGSFSMDGKENSSASYDKRYEYRFTNKSDYEVTVTVEKTTKKIIPHAFLATVITGSKKRVTVNYSPSDKVKPDGGTGTVAFNNR